MPPENYRRIIQEMLVILPDPMDKLQLLNRVLADFWRIPAPYRIYPRWAEIALRRMVLEQAERIRPGSMKKARQLMRQGVISRPRPLAWKVYQMRHVVLSTLALLLVWSMGSAVAAFVEIIHPESPAETHLAATPLFKAPVPPPPKDNPLSRETEKPTPPLPLGEAPPELSKTGELGPKSVEKEFQASTENRLKPAGLIFSLQDQTAPEICSHPVELSGNSETLAKPSTPRENHLLVSESDPETGELSVVAITSPTTEIAKALVKESSHTDPLPDYLEKPIWLVEKTGDTEIFSNRLHIITTHAVDNIPRSYLNFPRSVVNEKQEIKTSSQISGILFHASESDLYPFNPEMNNSIKKHTAALIEYLKRNKSYHYFIDRFGRIYRIVREDHAAFHAGRSIWADDRWYYLNLNHSFIGICFEGRDFETLGTESPGKGDTRQTPLLVPMADTSINDAQLRSGKELTDWLRVKYRIHEHNCVTHGLVSINRHRKLIGHHLDLSHNFPFRRFGLKDKYLSPLPSIVDFGFTFDSFFEKIFNGQPWPGVQSSVALLKENARTRRVDPALYQKNLQEKFDRYYAMEEELEARNEALILKKDKQAYTKTARNN